ncbi:hypothetical protein BH10PSE1_BH10PSE1_06730 [soil metagenome]
MSGQGDDAGGGSMAWGCLVIAILLAVLGAGLAVVFLWDVNA